LFTTANGAVNLHKKDRIAVYIAFIRKLFGEGVMLENQESQTLEFDDLEDRFGRENAYAILRALERFEGVREEWVSNMSREERLENVFRLMAESVRYQTRH
jgi:hypothetical protein